MYNIYNLIYNIYVCYIYTNTHTLSLSKYIVGGTGYSGEGRSAETTGANLDVAPVGALSGGEKSGMWRRSLTFFFSYYIYNIYIHYCVCCLVARRAACGEGP